jgi:hypothetical protein
MLSANLNQVGVHTGTLIATMPSPYASISTAVTFSITVIDPCLSATIIGSSYPAITTYIDGSGSSSRNYFYDSVSGTTAV